MVDRTYVGEPLDYKGHRITATLAEPDLRGQIDGQEMPHFYMSLAALREAAIKAIDDQIA